MNEYEFTLRYRLAEPKENPESYLNSLVEAGCDDALVGIGRNGRVALNFTRQANSAFEAISSAISDVQQAIPTATLIEAAPDFVGVTDLAELFGVSRQYMKKFIDSKGVEFPEPLHEGRPTLWHLSDVLEWSITNESRHIQSEVSDVARVNMQLNVSRTCSKLTAMLDLHRGKLEVLENNIFSTGEAWSAEQ